MERRRASRARCRIPCDVAVRGKTVEGTVRNISEGGLALVAPPEVATEGDSLALTLKPHGRPPIDLVALLWHARTLRRNGGGTGPVRLGLVLSEAGDDYFRLVDLLTGRVSAAPPATPEAERPLAPPAPDPTPLLLFALRVAQSGSPRMRRILVRAADADVARERALEETGPDWSVVAIALARDGEEPRSGG
jgi:hypothetical protein